MSARRAPVLAATDLPLALFVLSAAAALWPAHDRSLCGPPLAALAIGFVLYLVISRACTASRVWLFAAGTVVVGGAIFALYFLTQYPYLDYPDKVGIISRTADSLRGLVPPLSRWAPNRNSVATCLEGVLFLAAALAWTRAHWLPRIAWGLPAVVLAAALLLTASRGAWMAVAVTAGLWLVLGSRWIRSHRWASVLPTAAPLVIGLGACLWLAVGAAAAPPGGLGWLFGRSDRLDLYRQSLWLIRDYPLTGVGLGGQFALALSRYVLLIQVPYLTYSHNLYLEVWLQQGLLGAASWVWLLAAFVLSAGVWSRAEHPVLARGAGLGVLAMLLHGIVDARQYVDVWCWLPFFALLGLHAAAVRTSGPAVLGRGLHAIPALLAVLFVGATLWALRPVTAAVWANLGAVRQTAAETWATDTPGERRAWLLSQAEADFRRALAIAPSHPSANFRLGLLLMNAGRFDEAERRLGVAWEHDQRNTAAQKALGLTRVWLGNLSAAAPLLQSVPGIADELNTWGSWRASQGQTELAVRAYRMSLRLAPDQPPVREALAALEKAVTPDRQ